MRERSAPARLAQATCLARQHAPPCFGLYTCNRLPNPCGTPARARSPSLLLHRLIRGCKGSHHMGGNCTGGAGSMDLQHSHGSLSSNKLQELFTTSSGMPRSPTPPNPSQLQAARLQRAALWFPRANLEAVPETPHCAPAPCSARRSAHLACH
jgi:hypothetical protein